MTGPLTPAHLDRLSAMLRAGTGLVFPKARRGVLRRAAEEAMREIGTTDPNELVRLVSTIRGELGRVARLATIGETYLFRHPEQLTELRRTAIEPLVASRQRDVRPRLRIWSAGCAAGEEAYTLAMIVADAIPDIDRWDVRVVGTDLNGEALARARIGAYPRWSVRGRLGRFERWLQRGGNGGVRVEPEIRRLVTFEQHNLASLPTLPAALRDGAVDVIACRNVMIYLDRSVLARVLDGFRAALAKDGWLVVSPVEASIHGLRERFEVRPTSAGALYRRGDGSRPPVAKRPVHAEPHSSAPLRAAPAAVVSAREAVPMALAPATGDSPAIGTLESAKALADAGHLAEARQACLALLRRDPTSVDGYLLLASIAEAQDDLDAASATLRRLLYLDRDNPSGQFRLGLLDWRLGHTRRARTRLQRAVELIEGRGDDEPLEHVDGLNPAWMRSVVGALLE